jgi:hypothetical protein
VSPFALWTIVALLVIPIVGLSVYSVVDVMRRNDIAAAVKATWILAAILVPLVGGLIYLIFRPTRPEDIRGFGRRHRQQQKVENLLNEKDDAASKENGAV